MSTSPTDPPPGPDDRFGEGWSPPEPDYGQYGQHGQQPGPGQPQTNGMAVGALVASLLGLLCGIGFIVGIVLGYVARNQIRESPGAQGGQGLATAAIVIGWVGVALMALAFVALFMFIFAVETGTL